MNEKLKPGLSLDDNTSSIDGRTSAYQAMTTLESNPRWVPFELPIDPPTLLNNPSNGPHDDVGNSQKGWPNYDMTAFRDIGGYSWDLQALYA